MSNTILNDLEGMRKLDKSGMLDFYLHAAGNYLESAKKAEEISLRVSEPENIVIAGMGGSAIGGELLKDYIRALAKVPVEISREYSLPAYADRRSLVILASYSGNTEETLGSLQDALKRNCMVFCVSSGGALIKYAQKLNLPYLQVRSGMPPRAALPHMFMPLLTCMERLKVIPSFASEFAEATKLLERISDDNGPEKPVGKNFTKRLALNLNGTTPFVYGFGPYRGVALRYKQQFNENAKIPAKWEYFSELNHNETMGWENAKELASCFSVIMIRDKAEPVEIRSRVETTKTLMQSTVPKIFEVWAEGKGALAKMFSTILVGDFTSVYLAYLRGVDPTPVNTVEEMKQKIEKNGVKKRIMEQLDVVAKGG